MAMSRYTYTPRVRGRSTIATVSISTKIYNAVNNGTLGFSSHVLKGGERIEHIAGSAYGSSTYWWIIAAASGIGWSLQAPPGTLIRIPKRLGEVLAMIR
jgi:nucleoid-associated protein YgaU|tara:strand:+ start:4683 stop:4979 length:297 start_codon:yes stop_codon:yes gene_type:complete